MKYAFHHIAISVRNLDKSQAFYEEFGFEQFYRYDEDDGSLIIVHMKLEQVMIELFVYKQNENMPRLDYRLANNPDEIGVKHLALAVSDIVEVLHELKQKGIAEEDTEIIQGRTKVDYFFIRDPDGMWVEIIQDNRQ